MNLTATINGVDYQLASDYAITQQAGSVSRTTCQVKLAAGQAYPRVLAGCTIYYGEVPLFSGDITSVDTPSFATGKEVIRLKLQIDSLEARLKRRRISISLDQVTASEIIQEIFDTVISQEGITLGAISTTSTEYENWNASFYSCYDAVQELAKKEGAQWYISPDKKFYFILKTDIETIPAPARVSGLRLSESIGDIRTSQTVVGASEETSNQTHSLYWTADSYNVQLNYQVSEIVGITINGTPAGVGIIGVDEEDLTKTFLYQYGQKNINLNRDATVKPTAGDLVVIIYKGYFDIIIENTNESLKAEIASISGSSGIIENILSDETIESDTDADTTATALLNENGERVQEITCELPDVAGTDIGTAWEVNHPTLGIAGVFVVTEKNISDYVNNFYVKLKLKNKGFSSEYGKVFKKDEKKVRPETKVYNTMTVNDVIKRPLDTAEIYDPVTCFPAIDGTFTGMAYCGQIEFYPA